MSDDTSILFKSTNTQAEVMIKKFTKIIQFTFEAQKG